MFELLSVTCGSWHVSTMYSVSVRYNWYHKQDTAVRGTKRGLIYCKYRMLHLNQGNVKKRERTPLSGLICTNSRISNSRRPSSRFIRIYPSSSFWKMSGQDSIIPLPPPYIFFFIWNLNLIEYLLKFNQSLCANNRTTV